MARYKVAIAQTEAGLTAAAGGYTILKSTIREFDTFVSGYDAHFLAQIANIGSIDIGEHGWVALARRP